MKIKSLLLSIAMLFVTSTEVFATSLPKDFREYLQSQKKVPSVRFDGVVVYDGDVLYIPVIPSKVVKPDEIKLVRTYPLNKSIDSLPDMMLFNNNYALLKVIKAGDETSTVRNMSDIPETVLSGIIPQDLLVPKGLVFPENLAGILGDVRIPFVGSAKAPSFIGSKKEAPLPGGTRIVNKKNYTLPSQLKNKLFFVNNFQTEYLQVFSSEVSEPLYSLKTSGVMKDVKSFGDGKYLIVATNKQKNLDIINVEDETVFKHIDITSYPSEIAVNGNTAYVASIDDDVLFIIDLETFKIKEKILLAGSPYRLSVSGDGTKVAYCDLKTSDIYVLDMQNDYENKLITKYPNISKLIIDGNKLYMASRTAPKLRVAEFDLYGENKVSKTMRDKFNEKAAKMRKKSDSHYNTDDIVSGFSVISGDNEDDEEFMYSTSIKDFDIGEKPVDMAKYNGKIYVLCAGDNSVYMFNPSVESITKTKLPMDGFSKSFGIVPGTNYAVITNMADLKYAVYDMDRASSTQTVPVSEYINMITILDRK